MNKHTREKDLMRPEVTTGPMRASTKVYTSPQGHDDLRVPMREIALSDPDEPTFRVYDTSGPYTDPNAAIDVEQGLEPVRADWIKARGGVEEYEGRGIRPEDNGNVSGKHLARDFPGKRKPLLGLLDERVAVNLPGELDRIAVAFLQRLIYRHGADGHRGIAQNPFAGVVNLLSWASSPTR